MAFFGVRLPDEFAARFDTFASSRGGRSGMLRRLMREAMSAEGAEVASDGQGGARGQSEKLTVRLKPDDRAALDAASAAAGMRRTEWALACLRGRLFSKPQFNSAQAVALVEARQELARISANLRDLVRVVREGDLPAEAVEGELAKVEAFRREVRDQLDGVRAAIDGADGYWAT